MGVEEFQQSDYIEMIQDTCREAQGLTVDILGESFAAYKTSNALAEAVEFWKWMNRNYSKASGHMFESNGAMQRYILQQ